jgi:hypothetical protein
MRLLKKTLLPALTLSAALVAAGPAAAAPSVEIERGTLFVRGGPEADAVALSVPASSPNLLRVDLGGGGPPFELPRRQFERIVGEGDAGDDSLRVDAPARLWLEPVQVDGGGGIRRSDARRLGQLGGSPRGAGRHARERQPRQRPGAAPDDRARAG